MVLEQVLLKKIKSKSFSFYFSLGFFYFLISFLFSYAIFPHHTGIMTIAILSTILIPTVAKLISLEEARLVREKKFSLQGLWNDNKDIIMIYLALFLGTLFSNLLIVFIIPKQTALALFSPQIDAAGLVGYAYESHKFLGLGSLFFHNLLVLFVAFLLSFFYGSGIIFVLWNASVWGTTFAFIAKSSANSALPLSSLFNTMLPSFPHLILESIAYILASLTGGVLSKAVIQEEPFSYRFNHIFTDALIFLFFSIVILGLGAILEYRLFL